MKERVFTPINLTEIVILSNAVYGIIFLSKTIYFMWLPEILD